MISDAKREQILVLHNQGFSQTQIAEQLGCCRSTVRTYTKQRVCQKCNKILSSQNKKVLCRTCNWDYVCTRCGIKKDPDQFPISKVYSKLQDDKIGVYDAHRRCCRQCFNEISLINTNKNPESKTYICRKSRYKKKYNATLEEAYYKLYKQNYKCEICKNEIDFDSEDRKIKASVDHCHNTSQMRGILCCRCNWSLGVLEENPEILKSMITYIKKYNNGNSRNIKD